MEQEKKINVNELSEEESRTCECAALTDAEMKKVSGGEFKLPENKPHVNPSQNWVSGDLEYTIRE